VVHGLTEDSSRFFSIHRSQAENEKAYQYDYTYMVLVCERKPLNLVTTLANKRNTGIQRLG
jgi:hypothetical protein